MWELLCLCRIGGGTGFFFFFLWQTVSVLMNLELRLGGEGLSWKTRRGG